MDGVYLMRGTLELNLIEAEFLKKSLFEAKKGFFVEVLYMRESKRTKANQSNGNTLKWNESISFNLHTFKDALAIRVLEEDQKPSEIIG